MHVLRKTLSSPFSLRHILVLGGTVTAVLALIRWTIAYPAGNDYCATHQCQYASAKDEHRDGSTQNWENPSNSVKDPRPATFAGVNIDPEFLAIALEKKSSFGNNAVFAASPVIPGQLGIRTPVRDMDAMSESKLFQLDTDPKMFVVANFPALIKNNHGAESHLFVLLKRIIDLAIAADPSEGPQVIDAGANHGIIGLYAAVAGARFVYAVEPQPALQKAIRLSARLNQIDDRMFIYPNAILDQQSTVSMVDASIAEGGINHIDLTSKASTDTFQVSTTRIDELEFHLPEKPIAFFKLDVEGFEGQGLRSATKLFEKRLVRNIFVEWGPPRRWTEYKSLTTAEAMELLTTMNTRYGFDLAILPSLGFEHILEKHLGDVIMIGGVKVIKIGKAKYQSLISELDNAGELYLWFYLRDDAQNMSLLGQ